MRRGYARVSTRNQNPAAQVDALTAAGCDRVFVDTASGKLDRRPEWDRLVDQLRPGDQLVVTRLDRIGRSVRHLIEVVADLERGRRGPGRAAPGRRHHEPGRAAAVPRARRDGRIRRRP